MSSDNSAAPVLANHAGTQIPRHECSNEIHGLVLSSTTSLFESLRKFPCGLVDHTCKLHALRLCLQASYALHTLIQPLITYPNLELNVTQ